MEDQPLKTGLSARRKIVVWCLGVFAAFVALIVIGAIAPQSETSTQPARSIQNSPTQKTPPELSIARRTIQDKLESHKHNPFRFGEPQTTVDGRPSLMGLSKDGKGTVILKGPPEDIDEFECFFMATGGIHKVEHVLNVAFALGLAAPGIEDSFGRLVERLDEIPPDGETKLQRRGISATVSMTQLVNVVFLTIRRV